ncbi:MAG: alpha/beta hydrolase [Burkholderiales bacterium]|nr:alpha/beta hydrolase [Burkholderiales bacterium]
MGELTSEFVEREYNNRALVPEHAAFFARWEKDSAYVRQTLECETDVAYGPDARHRIDLFPAPNPRGTLVFIHGGYWRSLDKSMFSWLAAPYGAAGIGVAMPNYRLAPAVRIDDIVEDAIAATNWLMLNGVKHRMATERVVLSGHSAGGHLTAALFATPWSQLRFDPARIVGGVPISGIADFEPIRRFSFNTDFRLDAAAVQRLDLHTRAPTLDAPLVVAVGGWESSEFIRQSRLLADAWRAHVRALLVLPGLNHFSVVDAFAERGQPLHDATLELF